MIVYNLILTVPLVLKLFKVDVKEIIKGLYKNIDSTLSGLVGKIPSHHNLSKKDWKHNYVCL